MNICDLRLTTYILTVIIPFQGFQQTRPAGYRYRLRCNILSYLGDPGSCTGKRPTLVRILSGTHIRFLMSTYSSYVQMGLGGHRSSDVIAAFDASPKFARAAATFCANSRDSFHVLDTTLEWSRGGQNSASSTPSSRSRTSTTTDFK